MKLVKISELKANSGVGFGTSGIRDLAVNLTTEVVYSYTAAFIKHLRTLGEIKEKIAIAGDRRDSTDRIMGVVDGCCQDNGLEVINCGKIPTPAVAYYGLVKGMPSIMVTGSHIPADRNGVKFNLANREILKEDEMAISQMEIETDDKLMKREVVLPEVTTEAKEMYVQRYLDFYKKDLLAGKKIGLYGHSAVGRDISVEIMEKLGAEVTKIDYSDIFIPIDTDAIGDDLVNKMRSWLGQQKLDWIVSTDGDGDRPLMTDESGKCIRSDILPVLTAKGLGIEAVATTVTANTLVEKTEFFKKIVRTKVGSPYIVEAMIGLSSQGFEKVAGYELNGGFLLNSDLENLRRLPTRDAVLSILGTMDYSIQSGKTVEELVAALPLRFNYSSSIKGIPTEKSLGIVEHWEQYRSEIEEVFGMIIEVNETDGLRLTFENGDIVHFRPSKNAPEFRDYTESDSEEKAKILSDKAIGLIDAWVK